MGTPKRKRREDARRLNVKKISLVTKQRKLQQTGTYRGEAARQRPGRAPAGRTIKAA